MLTVEVRLRFTEKLTSVRGLRSLPLTHRLNTDLDSPAKPRVPTSIYRRQSRHHRELASYSHERQRVSPANESELQPRATGELSPRTLVSLPHERQRVPP